MLIKDEIAIRYYEIVSWYKDPGKADLQYYTPLSPWEYDNAVDIAIEMFEFLHRRKSKSSSKMQDLKSRLKLGQEYLETCLVEGMLSEDAYIRTTCSLIYKASQPTSKST